MSRSDRGRRHSSFECSTDDCVKVEKPHRSITGIDPRRESSPNSANNFVHQKTRQKMLLEISRDPNLSHIQRQEEMKRIMYLGVEEKNRACQRRDKSYDRETMGNSYESIVLPDKEDQMQLMTTFKSEKSLHLIRSMSEIETIIDRVKENDFSLTVLDLQKRMLCDGHVIPLFDALGKNKCVVSLSLKNNRIGDEGCSALASTLLDNSTLAVVDLTGNNIGDEGLGNLCVVIPYSNTLAHLNLADNKFGDNGVSELAAALIDNTSLVHINLNGNLIGDKGATDLFNALSTANKSVISIALRLNVITDKGATALASALIDNESLLSIDLGHNKISNKGANDLLKVLTCNDTVREIKLDGNVNLKQKILADIQKMLERESSEDGNSNCGSIYSKGSKSQIIEEIISLKDQLEEDDEGIRSSKGGETIIRGVINENCHATSARVMKEEASMCMSTYSAIKSDAKEMIIDGDYSSENDSEKSLRESKVFEQSIGPESLFDGFLDENDATLAKRRAIRDLWKDESLSIHDRNEKIQKVMASDFSNSQFSSLEPESTVVKSLTSAPANNNKKGMKGFKMDSNYSIDDDSHRSGSNVFEESISLDSLYSDLPDESNDAVAKRRAIQDLMKDKSLSIKERNKKIQEIIMNGISCRQDFSRELESTAAKKKASADASDMKNGMQRVKMDNEYFSDDDSQKSLNQSKNFEQSISLNALYSDIPDKTNKMTVKRRAIQKLMKDNSLTINDRNRKIRCIMMTKISNLQLSSLDPGSTVESNDISTNTSTDPSSSEEMEQTTASVSTKQVSEREIDKAHNFQNSDISTRSLGNSEIRFHHNITCHRRRTFEGGMPTSIAFEWMQKMQSAHPKSHDDLLDVLLAHKYRLSVKVPPLQSFFRVVAVVFFARVSEGIRRQERFHVVGTNDEPHSISGSICAERAALMQLRFVPDLDEITKIIIVTDRAEAITPGLLCREFMSSFKQMPDSTPISLGRSICRKCGLTLSGKACADSTGCFNQENDYLQDIQKRIFDKCPADQEESNFFSPHDFLGITTTLRDLFPYPSVYARLSSKEAVAFGQKFVVTCNKGNVSSSQITLESYGQDRCDVSVLSDDISEEHHGMIDSSTRKKIALTETNDSISSQKGSFTLQQSREDGVISKDKHHDTNKASHDVLIDFPQHLNQLGTKSIRFSLRLRQSQRRKKLLKLATQASSLEISQQHIHPIRYGAAVLFSDGSVATASQKSALEYGCSLDAVGQLAHIIDSKVFQGKGDGSVCRPILLVQCDQFGIAHSPFAHGRAFLTERGYGDCKVLVHQVRHGKKVKDDNDNRSRRKPDIINLKLVEVPVSDLAPSPPDIFGKTMTENH